jgi:hypothetical protein
MNYLNGFIRSLVNMTFDLKNNTFVFNNNLKKILVIGSGVKECQDKPLH